MSPDMNEAVRMLLWSAFKRGFVLGFAVASLAAMVLVAVIFG